MLNFVLIALVYIGVFIPLPLIPVPWFKSGIFIYHLLAALMLLVLMLRLIRIKRVRVDIPVFALLIVAPAFSASIAIANGGDLRDWMVPLISFGSFFAFYHFGLNCRVSSRAVLSAAPVFLLLSALLGCVHYLTEVNLYVNPYLAEADDVEELTGFLGLTRGSLGVVYSVATLFVLRSIFFQRSRSVFYRWIAIPSVVIAGICIVLSGSRTGLVAFASACFFSWWLAPRSAVSRSLLPHLVVGIALAVILALGLNVMTFVDADRFTSGIQSESFAYRIQSQSAAIEYIASNPLSFIFGQGYSTANYIWKTGSFLSHPHNEFLLTLWSLGIVGLLGYLWFWGISIVRARRSQEFRGLLISIFLVTSVTALSVGGIFTPTLRLAYVGTAVFFLLGIMHRELDEKKYEALFAGHFNAKPAI